VIPGRLFRRFFWRFLAGIGLALFLFIPLVHIFQQRTVNREWREDLKQEASWFARHFQMTPRDVAARAWGQMHSATRVTFYTSDHKLISDSHPEREPLELDSLLAGRTLPRTLTALEKLESGSWLVMSRPAVPAFPHGLQWELVVAAVLIVGLALLLLYPLVRSMTRTLEELGELAAEVSAGHFGKTLPVERSDELGVLVRSFNDMSTRLAEAERLNTRLFHDVSHELRSPLGRIQALAHSVAEHPKESRACLRGIEQEIGLLDRLVADLLQAARLESKDGLRFETFSLQHWAGETLPRLASTVRERRIAWSTELPQEDREVRGDPQRLAQAVGNLVDNATNALEGRRDPRIDVRIALNGKAWTITVEDNGPGIPEIDQPNVFRRFYRADEHRNRDKGGVGLGLSLVHSIAVAHGGTATIESREGEGTRVRLELANDQANDQA
jgi:signal transduction histidine kinase